MGMNPILTDTLHFCYYAPLPVGFWDPFPNRTIFFYLIASYVGQTVSQSGSWVNVADQPRKRTFNRTYFDGFFWHN